ncbi:hypothetical protein AAE478_007140 [Parahypoxylon ruwenzoriense]
MRFPNAILGLPPSLLVLLLSAATQLHAQQQQHVPTAIRKMSLDEGEKFMPEYYAFGPSPLHARSDLPPSSSDPLLSDNSSIIMPFQQPYPRHLNLYHAANLGLGADDDDGEKEPPPPPPRRPGLQEGQRGGRQDGDSALFYRRARDVLSQLRGRQFACPEGTHGCTNIAQPNYCCTDGTTCFVVTNAPEAGNVGCCPEGQNCGGSVGSCTDGATACPADIGGGCCIPGFACADVGCVFSTVSVITQPQTTITSTILSTPTPTTQIVTVIVTVTPTDGGAPVISTTTQTTTVSGGAGGGIPPYRPTGTSTPTTSPSPTTSSTSSPIPTFCPTGFYACLASAGGGCCRTGRDCSTTSCPAGALTTVVATNGATVVVPASDAAAATRVLPSPTCAGGWYLCSGADAGPIAGCCPEGYVCGVASCTLSAATATATVQKELPSAAAGFLLSGPALLLRVLGPGFLVMLWVLGV